MEVIVKQIEKKDFEAARKFALDGMHLSWYTSNKLELYLYSKYVLYLELTKSTMVLGAYLKDRLVGFLFANFHGDKVVYDSWMYRLYMGIVEKFMRLFSKEDVSGPYDQANREMLEEFSRHNPDGELTFFAVDPSLKGKRIGSILLAELEKRKKGKLIYLYTDTGSTYQFYEKRGFTISGKRDIVLPVNGRGLPLTCFLFSKRL
ncbi:MAG: GNAT family N-acetyltransferase [Enterococcus sp.]